MRLPSCRAEIIASSVDGTVRRFDVRMGCMDVDRLGAPVTAMALSHDGNCVLASCLDARMRLLDKASGELLAQYTGELLSNLIPAYVMAWACWQLTAFCREMRRQRY